MPRSVLAVLAVGALSTVAAADVTLLGVLGFPTNQTDQSGLSEPLTDKVAQNTIGALGSAIAWTGKDQRYLMLPDRGPGNGNVAYRCRVQTIEMSIEPDGISTSAPKCVATTMLTDETGRQFVGISSAIDAADPSHSLRLDPEGVRVGADGTIYVSEEYGPWILAFGTDGKLLRRLTVPEKFLCRHPDADAAKEKAANTTGRIPNKGFEGLAITPAGDRLLAILQSPLIQDGSLDSKGKATGLNIRILDLPASGQGPTREYVYQLSAPHNGVNELLAVNDHEFLLVERDSKAGEAAKDKKIYRIDVTGASDVSGVESLPTTGLPDGVKPVAKTLFLDLLSPKFNLADDQFPEKIEGLAFGPDLSDGRHVLFVTSDNDFDPMQNTFIYFFGIDAKDLPGFTPQAFTGK